MRQEFPTTIWGPDCSSWICGRGNNDERRWPSTPLVQFRPWGGVVAPSRPMVRSSAANRIFLGFFRTVLLATLTTACGGESTTHLCTTTENQGGSATVSCPGDIPTTIVPGENNTSVDGPDNADRTLSAPTDLVASDGESDHAVTLSWREVEGASECIVHRILPTDCLTAARDCSGKHERRSPC